MRNTLFHIAAPGRREAEHSVTHPHIYRAVSRTHPVNLSQGAAARSYAAERALLPKCVRTPMQIAESAAYPVRRALHSDDGQTQKH